jgi:hypothetical protein
MILQGDLFSAPGSKKLSNAKQFVSITTLLQGHYEGEIDLL